ncbi:hypothetical protein FEM48_Zijuj09G0183300 [Ziziphus jujuba var. spinosa]|uniref:non-specific serine/threonine protein kinase n=1 Tax=Ziziphus jujuba var. spinosa TaxID=714518 RepID=A0A978UUJ9_ZIZJJ|nr:hypothetical protein FEM48_Zijuj09G0183300 [Ziziphus jujuba var. spinosa]
MEMAERVISVISAASYFLWLILLLGLVEKASANAEGDALNVLKTNLADPNNVLQSWDATLVNPCTYDLGNANLYGQLVRQLGQLSNLQYLELSSNNISGTIPEELGNLTNLVSLDLYLNNLSGSIPTALGNLQQLRFLYEHTSFTLIHWLWKLLLGKLIDECRDYKRYWNQENISSFSARVPGRISAGTIVLLRLNNNILYGSISMSLTTVNSLQVLDLSNNKLKGDIPTNGSFHLFTPISFTNNLLNEIPVVPPPPITPTPSAPPPPFTPTPSAPSGNSATGAIAGVVAAGAALLYAAPAITLAWWLLQKLQDHFFDVPGWLIRKILYLYYSFLCTMCLTYLPCLQLKRIQKFIWDSSKDFLFVSYKLQQMVLAKKKILGRGGFGKVYKGCLADVSLVAVKRLRDERTQGGKLQFQTEVEMTSMAVHRNLLRLRRFCMTPTEQLLVYPYMANGSVASCLRGSNSKYKTSKCQIAPESQPPLDWQIRQRIALGAAKGLAYLHDHCDPKIIHRDVKAANILLDEEFEAVVGDFGLAKLMDYKNTHVTTAVRGTIGHIAPECVSTGKSSEKTDVFGYGVMLLELITGQRAFDLAQLANDDDVMLLDWVEGLLKDRRVETLVDSDLHGNYIDDEVEQLIQLALLCTQGSPAERPKMSEVVRMLEGDGLVERWESGRKRRCSAKTLITITTIKLLIGSWLTPAHKSLQMSCLVPDN